MAEIIFLMIFVFGVVPTRSIDNFAVNGGWYNETNYLSKRQ